MKHSFSCSLQIHFRRDHFLCEDEACLAKKFVVFQSEAEMKVIFLEQMIEWPPLFICLSVIYLYFFGKIILNLFHCWGIGF